MISKGSAGALDGVPFETDEDFTKFAKKELKKEDSEKLTNEEIKMILLKWVRSNGCAWPTWKRWYD